MQADATQLVSQSGICPVVDAPPADLARLQEPPQRVTPFHESDYCFYYLSRLFSDH